MRAFHPQAGKSSGAMPTDAARPLRMADATVHERKLAWLKSSNVRLLEFPSSASVVLTALSSVTFEVLLGGECGGSVGGASGGGGRSGGGGG